MNTEILEKQGIMIEIKLHTKAEKYCPTSDERSQTISALCAWGFDVQSKLIDGQWVVTGYKIEEQ